MRIDFENNALDINRAIINSAEVTMKAIDLTISRAALEIANLGKMNAPRATSQLTNAINTVRFGFADYGIYSGVDYAKYVEDGTGPGGSPPVQSIIDWIRVNRITPDDPYMDTEDLAFVIAKSISINGTPKQPFLRPAFNNIIDKLPMLMSRNVAKALAK